jgi:sulfite exporter TauE/SafE
MLLYTAFILGFAGSFHCIGMCGPIALALPIKKSHSRIGGILTYNLGRIVTYAILGSLTGLIGRGFILAGIQQKISVGIGLLILLSLVLPKIQMHYLRPDTILFRFVAFLKKCFSNLFKSKSYGALFSIGLLNGLLPCGFVYLAMAAAILNTSILNSVLFMGLFGLGTVPMMLSISWLPNFMNDKARNNMLRTMPFITLLLAILFIVRGLNLGIPYLSPEYNDSKPIHVKCCHR